MKTIILDGVEYDLVPKESKSELDLLKEKYATGNYEIYARPNDTNGWSKHSDFSSYNRGFGWVYRLIHNKDADIAEAVAKDSSVEVEWKNKGKFHIFNDDFFDTYDETLEYRIKPTKPKGRFIPEDNINYYTIDTDGEVTKEINVFDILDRERVKFGNCFRTQAHAEQARDYLAKVLPILGFVLEYQGDLSGNHFVFRNEIGVWRSGTGVNYYPVDIRMQKETAEALLADEDMMKHLKEMK
jgi:hypothetical protein